MRSKLLAFAAFSLAFLLTGCGSGSSTANTAPAGSAYITLSASSLTFPSTTVGQSSTAQTITVTNTGTASATLTSDTVSDATDFTLTSSACGSTLAANSSCMLSIVFNPKSAGTLTSTVTVTDNATNSPQTVTLTGTGTAVGSAYITLSASSLTFPSTTVGQSSSAQTITVTNTGTASATLTSDTVSDATDFTLTSGTCGSTLAASASCTFSIVFNPKSAATLIATVTVTDNATNSPQTITFTGTGVAASVPQATLSSSTIAFPTTNVGSTSAAQSVTLTNGGTGPLSISTIVLGGVNLDQFSTSNTCTTTLAASAACTITATFAPTQIGTFSATVTVTDNANNVSGSTQVVTLTGTSAGPLASLNPTSLTFAGTTVNQSATAQTVVLSNTGTATLNITSIAVTGGATSSAFAITANTCGTTLAASASCSVSVNFTPTITGTFLAYLTFNDNSPGSPQSVTLNGTGQTAPAPIATLTATSIAFPTTLPTTTSASSSVTLTNTGSATLNIASIVLGGANPSDFAETTTCGTTLAVNATCTILATFTPAAAASYAATVTLTDNNNNVANSTQTIALTGTGGTNTTYHNLYIWPQADGTPIYTLVNAAQKSIDMTMYALNDTTMTNDLVAACKRGVVVRVILDQNNEMNQDKPAYNALNAQSGCSAVWANKAFAVTHEKSLMIDGTIDVVMSLNLQSQYYSTTRDYAIVDNDSNDYAADEATFTSDYAAGTPSSGVAGTSDYTYVPGIGTDLTWSPYPEGTSATDMVAIINNATKTLYIECEEFSASSIVTAVANAAQRGVAVVLIGENESNSYTSYYATIKTAGASVYYYSSSTGFYVHAKTVVADQGTAQEAVYMGSINYSNASLNSNRELGIYIHGNPTVSNPIAATIKATVIADESQTGVTHY